MTSDNLNDSMIRRGKALFSAIADEKPSLFNKGTWIGKVMDWSMKNEQFKTQMFRFVDVFPSLTTDELLTRHIREYFGEEQDMPPVLLTGAKVAGLFGALGGSFLNKIIATNIHEMAQQFILGESIQELVKNIEKLRKDGFAAVIDVLGEATLSEQEADAYVATYLELLNALNLEQQHWKGLGDIAENNLDWGYSPKINIAVKPTALFCLANPQDFEGSVVAILNRVRVICEKVVELNGFLSIDMETYRHKDIILEVYRRLKLEFKDYPYLGVVLQAYLRENDKDVADLLHWAKSHQTRISIRLVKGAYVDYETIRARQNNWEIPVWTIKAETDAAFERQAKMILENHAICYFACASHNIRSVAAVMEIAHSLQVPDDRYEFQLLYGMAEPIRNGIRKVAGRVRLYCPYGSMIPGMGYLVRRLLENTANESFLRQSFAEDAQIERLLEDPVTTLARGTVKATGASPTGRADGLAPFRNEPPAYFVRAEQRVAFPKQIAEIRRGLGRTYPLFINGKDVTTSTQVSSVNPAKPSEILGHVCQAGVTEVGDAIAAAKAAYPAWRDTPPRVRAGYLLDAAKIMRERIFELSAWQVLEIGKQWDQAYADVGEAIDFLEYYAREMIRLGSPKEVGRVPGEGNHYSYEPRGVAAVIAPWNFPLAISTGMVSAAIVTGNCVVFKPSGITPIIGHQLVEIFKKVGLPAGVFNFTPGSSSIMGDFLIDHPDINMIAFTGSMETGLRIIERAARVHPGQAYVKKVVCEMGGKNAIIIDDDADMDEAVPHVLNSAFGFQGQKCSACSRVIVLDAVYDKFVTRLVAMAQATRIGPAEDPAFYMGPVADAAAQKKILEYIEVGKKEGQLLYKSSVPAGEGYFVPMTILGDILPDNRLAQEEIFGPVLSIMRVKSFDQAIEWANSTPFALTGGVFSRSPEHLDQARRAFRVGNLYLNRNITGAMVERQPFGGAKMSGVGTKAGGPDYLLHFMDPRVVTENTMRRGFAPLDDENG